MRWNLLPVLLSNLWELLLRLLILPCYASRRGLGECIHDRREIVNYLFNLRWQLKYTSGWIEAPGEPSVACIFGNPGVPCDFPMDGHPGSKGTEMIHARNFCVQPQAIMGSSIVE